MEFNSPSTAAYFLFGANASGPQTGKDENGMTMLEHDKLAAGVLKEPTDREYLGFLKTVEGNEGSKCHYPTRLDTYGCGCGHNRCVRNGESKHWTRNKGGYKDVSNS